MMKILNLGFYSHINILQLTPVVINGSSSMFLTREKEVHSRGTESAQTSLKRSSCVFRRWKKREGEKARLLMTEFIFLGELSVMQIYQHYGFILSLF